MAVAVHRSAYIDFVLYRIPELAPTEVCPSRMVRYQLAGVPAEKAGLLAKLRFAEV